MAPNTHSFALYFRISETKILFFCFHKFQPGSDKEQPSISDKSKNKKSSKKKKSKSKNDELENFFNSDYEAL